ncbi:MAG TPA: hypothetical protein VJ779_13335 [Acetobacteraceae bacterium]|nr:hypothetical protein [Acetobacteraceae bacterium]
MALTIFFSWQADTSTRTGRNLVEQALERAASAIGQDSEVEEAMRELAIDKDTKGVAGSPPIVETIFRKIDGAAVFVPDLTFVGKRLDGRPTPNPNVLIEYGWALKSLSHSRIVPVMNVAHGQPTSENMPFDMRHLRHPIQYECPDDADEETRRRARASLARSLEGAIRDVLGSAEFKASLPKPMQPPPFPAREPLDGPGRFRAKTQPLGISDYILKQPSDVKLQTGPATWLRLMPSTNPGRQWSFGELKGAATAAGILMMPIGSGQGSYGHIRAEDGFGIYATQPDQPNLTCWVVFAFETGEVWSVDAFSLGAARDAQGQRVIHLKEKEFAAALESYSGFLSRLGVDPPYRWVAGMEDLRGRVLYVPAPPGRIASPFAKKACVSDSICKQGLYQPSEPAIRSLKPFFEAVYDKCDLVRPQWLDAQQAATTPSR